MVQLRNKKNVPGLDRSDVVPAWNSTSTRSGTVSNEYCVVMYQSHLSVCSALTFENLGLDSSLLVCSYTKCTSSEYLGYFLISRSLVQGQGHRSKKNISVYPVHGWLP